MKVSPGSTVQVVVNHPVDDPLDAPSDHCAEAQEKPVPDISVVHVPLGQPSYQQHSDKAVLIAM